MDRRTFLAGVSGVGSVALAGCNGQQDGSANAEETDYDVGMGGAFFRPAEIEIAAGETVVWRNTGSRGHTVTAYENRIPDDAEYFASGGYDSEQAAREGWQTDFGGRIDSGGTYEHTFEVPGEYHYLCIPHEPQGMDGTVVVTE